MAIDIAFDFRTDADGKNPDSHSPTLRRYHRLLWSKPLPSGACFDLSETTPGVNLHHNSTLGEFFLSSDPVIATFTRWQALKPIRTRRGRPHQGTTPQKRVRTARRAAAMLCGGVDPGVLDEVQWWRSDDLWYWSLEALVAYVRAAADRLGEPPDAVCGLIAHNRDITLTGDVDP